MLHLYIIPRLLQLIRGTYEQRQNKNSYITLLLTVEEVIIDIAKHHYRSEHANMPRLTNALISTNGIIPCCPVRKMVTDTLKRWPDKQDTIRFIGISGEICGQFF